MDSSVEIPDFVTPAGCRILSPDKQVIVRTHESRTLSDRQCMPRSFRFICRDERRWGCNAPLTFQFTKTEHRRVSTKLASTRDRPYVVYRRFTACADLCTLQQAVLALLPSNSSQGIPSSHSSCAEGHRFSVARFRSRNGFKHVFDTSAKNVDP